ncbi:MAG: hypothetical protein JWQ09_2804 [Segetibacter sp.]|nr:hypothetical protein [Segetibacter sp.]
MSSFSRDIFFTFAWRTFTIGFSFATSIILARYLTPEERGHYAVITLSISLLVLISNIGLADGTIYLASKETYEKVKVFFTGFFAATILAIIATILCFLIFFLFPKISLYNHRFNFVFFAIIPQAISIQIRHTFLGYKKIKVYNLLMGCDSVLLLMGLLIIFILYQGNLKGALLIYLLVFVCSFIVHFFFMLKEVRKGFKEKKIDITFIKELLPFGFKFFIAGIGNFSIERLSVFLLEYFKSNRSVGFYVVAGGIPTLFAIIPTQVSLVLYPYVANAKNEEKKIDLFCSVMRTMTIISFLGFLCVGLILPPLLGILYGKTYAVVNWTVLFLMLSVIFSGMSGVFFNFFAGVGKAKYGVILTSISGIIVLITSITLIPFFDYTGAAISKMIASMAGFIYLLFVFMNSTEIKWQKLFLFTKSDLSILVVLFKKLNFLKIRN